MGLPETLRFAPVSEKLKPGEVELRITGTVYCEEVRSERDSIKALVTRQ